MKRCGKCGFVNDKNAYICHKCKYEQFTPVRSAGFWLRFIAVIIDFIILSPLYVLSYINLLYIKNIILMPVAPLIIFIFYRTFMHYKFGATLGKMILRFKVLNDKCGGISFRQSVIRELLMIISGILNIFILTLLFSNQDFLVSRNYAEIQNISQSISPSVNLVGIIWPIFIMIDCLIASFTPEKKAFHDFVARTYCIKNEKKK